MSGNELSGKVALVTGAPGALGQAVVRSLLAAGSSVAGTYRSNQSGLTGLAMQHTVQADLADESSVVRCFADVRSALGSPDIIVHCAGGFRSDGLLDSTSVDTWNHMMTMNLTSSFLVVRQALRELKGKPFGRIILVSALSAQFPGKGAGAYKVSKAGVNALVSIAHAERSGTGITVNALAPGTIDTPSNRSDMPDADPTHWTSPDHIAATVVHLCTEAGGATSGTVIPFP